MSHQPIPGEAPGAHARLQSILEHLSLLNYQDQIAGLAIVVVTKGEDGEGANGFSINHLSAWLTNPALFAGYIGSELLRDEIKRVFGLGAKRLESPD